MYTKATDAKSRPDFSEYGRQLWQSSESISAGDPVSMYLRSRGIMVDAKELRYQPKMRVKETTGTKAYCGMVARFVSPDGKTMSYHRTFLTSNGQKAKAEKVRMFAPGPTPEGGAVRLANSAETMGIAEGIETALSAMQLFEVPVWAACDAGKMLKWRPPASGKKHHCVCR